MQSAPELMIYDIGLERRSDNDYQMQKIKPNGANAEATSGLNQTPALLLRLCVLDSVLLAIVRRLQRWLHRSLAT